MAVRHGYGKIAGTDALVFAYDTGDTSNSYKGEPTTNLLPAGVAGVHDAASGNAVTVTDATSEKGPGWKKVTITARGSNYRTLQWTYLSMSSNTLYCHSAVFDWGNMRGKNYFIYFDGNGTGTRAYYRPGDYINQGSYNINSTMPDGKFAGTITHTASHLHAFFIGNYTTGVSGLNDYFYYKEFQVEVNSHPTQYTGGTRSATQGLLDLTGNSTIDLTNVSFDSNAQMTFDGTNDYADLGSYLTGINTSVLSIELVFKSNTVTGNALQLIGWMENENPHGYICTGNFTGAWGNESLSFFNYSSGGVGHELSFAYTNGHDFLNDTNYHHAVITLQNADYKIYVDGAQVTVNPTFRNGSASSAMTSNLFGYGSTPSVVIGAGSNPATYAAVTVPVVKIYNKILTAADVRNNFNFYKGRFGM